MNFETNFFTETVPFDRTVVLLGQQVQLHIVPSSFGWRFGDGAVLSSAEAGARYPDLRITHDYQRKGQVQAVGRHDVHRDVPRERRRRGRRCPAASRSPACQWGWRC